MTVEERMVEGFRTNFSLLKSGKWQIKTPMILYYVIGIDSHFSSMSHYYLWEMEIGYVRPLFSG